MPTDTFERRVLLGATPEATWTAVTDIQILVSWIPILSDVEEHRRLASYSAVLTDRIGLFSLSADLSIEVTDIAEGRSITLRAEGRDRLADSRIFIEGKLDIGVTDGGTELRIAGRYEVTGKVATFGGPMIRSRAKSIVNDFFTGVTDSLG